MGNNSKNIFFRLRRKIARFPAGCQIVKIIILILIFLPLIFFGCQSIGNGHSAIITDDDFQYDLSKPVDRWVLPPELREISGLGYMPDGQLACIQDEKGILYMLNFETREINKLPFAKKGDYEGVEIIGDSAYVLKSNGDLYVFSYKNKDPEVHKVKTPLTDQNNSEALAYDPITKTLLIGCKGKAALKSNHAKGKAIYAFNLTERTLSAEPVFLLKSKELKEALYSHHLNPYKQNGFRISGLAVHPVTRKIYTIGTVGKLMIILDRNQKIKSVASLSPHLFIQPEGICFDPKGIMYISSEGKSGMGYILKFAPLENKK